MNELEIILLLFRRLPVAAHKLIYAACGIDELRFTRVERMRTTRYFEFYHGIGFAFKLHGVCRLARGTREEHIAVAHILEHNWAIIVGMNTFFHCML